MNLNLLPNELLKEIISHLHIKDAKNISLTSKRMRSLALERIWSKPKFNTVKPLSFLSIISRFPISELCSRHFDCSLNEIIETIPILKALNVDSYKYIVSLKELESIKIPIKLSSRALQMDANDMTLYDHILQVIKNNTLISLDLNHPNPFNDESFDLAEIRALSKKVRISSISIVCCHVTEKNIVEFIDVMATLGNCRLNISHGDKYLFTVSDLKMMAEKNIKITTIYTNQLKTEYLNSNLVKLPHFVQPE